MSHSIPERADPIHPGQYHLRILRTAGVIGTELKLFVPGRVRHDTSNAVVESVPADNPLHLAVGDCVLLNMKEGRYGMDMEDGSERNVKYLVHPGKLMFVDATGNNHFMVDREDILAKIRRN